MSVTTPKAYEHPMRPQMEFHCTWSEFHQFMNSTTWGHWLERAPYELAVRIFGAEHVRHGLESLDAYYVHLVPHMKLPAERVTLSA